MQREFWLERWKKNEIGWHQAEVNPWLDALWSELDVPAASAVFVPLCGKSLDMRWLNEQGHPVVGVELSDHAVRAYFQEAAETFATEPQPYFMKYVGASATIYCGDNYANEFEEKARDAFVEYLRRYQPWMSLLGWRQSSSRLQPSSPRDTSHAAAPTP